MAKVPQDIAAIRKITYFMCLFCDRWCESSFFTLETPVFVISADTIAAWFGFYEEGVMDVLPSAHILLESPRSFCISTLS